MGHIWASEPPRGFVGARQDSFAGDRRAFCHTRIYAIAYLSQPFYLRRATVQGLRGCVYTYWMTPIVLRVKELRTAQGLTQKQLAERAKIRQATVSKLESGRIKSIDLEVLEKLAKALGCDPGYLIVKKGK